MSPWQQKTSSSLPIIGRSWGWNNSSEVWNGRLAMIGMMGFSIIQFAGFENAVPVNMLFALPIVFATLFTHTFYGFVFILSR